ncbi:MAG: hypothetical protein ACI9F9_000265 [Candidatus Paceibacteria bacterium]|jgi:hypothetical protein
MHEFQHRIKVFVYRLHQGQPHYLLLRKSEGHNPIWGALDGPIGFGEQIETAVTREVCNDVGLLGSRGPIDLQMPKRWVLGDEEIVEWPYGFQTSSDPSGLILDSRWSEYRWAAYSEAFGTLQLELDRAAVTRLHTLIGAA